MRNYKIKLYDKEGKLVLILKSQMLSKQQTSGHLGIGDVEESFIVGKFKIRLGRKYGGKIIQSS